MKYYTYLWFRENMLPYYVGKGSGDRAYTSDSHCVKCPKVRARIFVQFWESEDKAFEMEKWYISLFGRKDLGIGCLRNLTDGGENPPSAKGRKMSKEFCLGISRRQEGRKLSEETKNKIRVSKKGRDYSYLNTPEVIEKRANTNRSVPKVRDLSYLHTPEMVARVQETQRLKRLAKGDSV